MAEKTYWNFCEKSLPIEVGDYYVAKLYWLPSKKRSSPDTIWINNNGYAIKYNKARFGYAQENQDIADWIFHARVFAWAHCIDEDGFPIKLEELNEKEINKIRTYAESLGNLCKLEMETKRKIEHYRKSLGFNAL